MIKLRHIRIPYWYLLLIPYIAFALGFAMNTMATAFNGSQMPVLGCSSTFVIDADDIHHVCMTAATHLKILTDWIFIPGLGTASPGDLLEMVMYDLGLPAMFGWVALVIRDYSGYRG